MFDWKAVRLIIGICNNVKIDYVNRDACKACSLRERCTRSFRRVSRLENEAVLDRMTQVRE